MGGIFLLLTVLWISYIVFLIPSYAKDCIHLQKNYILFKCIAVLRINGPFTKLPENEQDDFEVTLLSC